MNQTIRTVLLGLFACAWITAAAAADTDKPKVFWKAKGDLEEACSCNAPCPCWFMAKPSRMTCNGMQILFIKSGRYGKTSLDGLALAQFVQSPEGKSMFESVGNWNVDILYIDEKANEDQRAALRDMAGHLFPPGGKERIYKYVPTSRKIEGDEHTCTVGNVSVCAGHLVEGGYAGVPKVVNPPLADPTHKEYLQGQTTKFTYTDAKQDWDYQNSNYMRNEFDVTSREYEKYEADLQKKLAAMQKDAK